MSVRRVRRWWLGLALGAGVTAGGCFDGEELTDGLPCTEDSHCGGSLRCLADPAYPGTLSCQQVDSACPDTDASCDSSATTVSTTAGTMSTTADSMSTTVGSTCVSLGESCANGEVCCTGSCLDDGTGTALTCRQTCSYGTECAESCCCTPLGATGYNTCEDTSFCGPEAACPSAGCASPGSLCSYDADCCGGRCLLNAVGSYSCFKTCTVPTDCASACCNYKPDFATSICEQSC